MRIGIAIRTTWNVLLVMLSAWKAKMHTRVDSSAATVTGWRNERNLSNQALPLVLISHVLDTTPAARGMTMKKTTA